MRRYHLICILLYATWNLLRDKFKPLLKRALQWVWSTPQNTLQQGGPRAISGDLNEKLTKEKLVPDDATTQALILYDNLSGRKENPWKLLKVFKINEFKTTWLSNIPVTLLLTKQIFFKMVQAAGKQSIHSLFITFSICESIFPS